MMSDKKKFYLIREDVLPESIKKTLKVKSLLDDEPRMSIFDAVRRFDLSRSAYYKYKDTIFPVDDTKTERNVTMLLHVDDNIGLLSRVLELIAAEQGSVLTIHQSLPIKEKTTITITLNATQIELTINGLLDQLKNIDGVNHVQLIGMTM
nr:ACT domain-containing protein [Macrococcus lamae]